jgi:hypothetical protein
MAACLRAIRDSLPGRERWQSGFPLLAALTRPRPWEEPLRREMRTRPVTFQAVVALQTVRGPVHLSVHGDAFEVVQRVPVIGFLNGTDYCYRAPDTLIETARGWPHDWITIRGQPGTGAAPIRIGQRKMNRQIWDVLVSAGAHPVGPPPAR